MNIREYVVTNKRERTVGTVLWVSIVLLVVVFFTISMPAQLSHAIDPAIILSFISNGMLFIYGIVISQKRYPFSISFMLWTFSFIFMFYAPLIQYINNVYPWDYQISDEVLIQTNNIVSVFSLITMVTYEIIYYLKTKDDRLVLRTDDLKKSDTYINNLPISEKKLACISYCMLFYIILFVIRLKPSDFLSKYKVEKVWDIAGISSLTTLFSTISKYIVAFVFLFNVLIFVKNKKIKLSQIVSLVAFIMVLFPLSTTRFVLATTYLGIVVVLIQKKKLSVYVAPVFFICFLLIFRLMGAMSHLTVDGGSLTDIIKNFCNNFSRSFFSGDYDAYSNLAKAVEYIAENGTTNGRQLLGCFLFFIPRTIWKTKPIGSGALVAEIIGQEHTNISMPFIGEGLINFGFLGVIIYAIVIATIIVSMDINYWNIPINGFNYCEKSKKPKLMFRLYFNIAYPFILFLSFFCLRGDFLSSFTHLSTLIVISILVYWFVMQRNKTNSKV